MNWNVLTKWKWIRLHSTNQFHYNPFVWLILSIIPRREIVWSRATIYVPKEDNSLPNQINNSEKLPTWKYLINTARLDYSSTISSYLIDGYISICSIWHERSRSVGTVSPVHAVPSSSPLFVCWKSLSPSQPQYPHTILKR